MARVKVTECGECKKRHDPTRPHCPRCGTAMVSQQRQRVYGWGCGNQYHGGCGFWMPLALGYAHQEDCLECHEDTPHFYWIYDEENQSGERYRKGEWLCSFCFGPLPKNHDKVMKETPALLAPVRYSEEVRQSNKKKAREEKYKDALHLWFVKGRNPKHGHEQWQASFEDHLYVLREEDWYHPDDGLVPVEIFREFPGGILLVKRI